MSTNVDFPDNPNEQLGFEITPQEERWSFVPEFYPDSFTEVKQRELDRHGNGCGGEKVRIKNIKNREYHATGVILQGEIPVFHRLMDFDGRVDILSPKAPDGGMECHIKKAELGEQKGWDPHTRQWMFKYTLDLVSTGHDEYERQLNGIVTPILHKDPENDFKADYNGPAYGL